MGDNNEEEKNKQKSTHKKRTVKKSKCYNCNKYGHLSFNCPLSKVNCHRCGLRGHYFWDCNVGPTNIRCSVSSSKKAETLPGNGSLTWVVKRVDEVESDPPPKVNCHRCGLGDHYFWDCIMGPTNVGWSISSSKKGETLPGNGSLTWVVKRVDEVEFDPFKGPVELKIHDKENKGNGGLVCVKRREDVKKVEEVEDCFILDFDPAEITKEEDYDDNDEGFKELISIVCVKKREDVKKVELVEDCFILEFDPDEPVKFSNMSLSVCKSDALTVFEDDLSIVAEKGQVACRDFPHPRHLCAKYPFNKTSHTNYCEKCYCYICDIPAPCAKWTWSEGPMHCDAVQKYQVEEGIKVT